MRLSGVMAVVLLSACGQAATPTESAPSAGVEEAGFLQPPRVVSVRRAGVSVVLAGVARPRARVRLATPSGDVLVAAADGLGRWSVTLPSVRSVALFGLSSEAGGRRVQSDGYLAILPAPGPAAVVLRAGAGARPVSLASGRTAIVAVDVDASGAAVLTGPAPADAPISVWLDGVTAAQGRAGSAGYHLPLTASLSTEVHRLTVRGPDAEAAVDLPAIRPRRPVEGAFGAERFDAGWRIDWMTPGGGVQTTLVFDAARAAR